MTAVVVDCMQDCVTAILARGQRMLFSSTVCKLASVECDMSAASLHGSQGVLVAHGSCSQPASLPASQPAALTQVNLGQAPMLLCRPIQ
jgi:hypothetical protein